MKFTIEWSVLALEDRSAIFKYIEDDNPSAAVGVDLCIAERIDHLRWFPDTGRPGRVEGTRELVISGTPYIAAYRIAKNVIVILRILHGAQEWPASL